MKELIEKYKKHIANGGLKGEIYKWELLGKFRGRPDLNADDFNKEIRNTDFGNLIYPVGIGAMHHLAKDRTEAYKKCFIALFDESNPLEMRLDAFNAGTLELYRQLVPDPKLSHHHDERTMATCLAFHNPDKYPLYKDSFYRAYCKYLGISVKGKGRKYLHYIELLNEFIRNYILPDKDLQTMVDDLIPSEYYRDPNRLLLAQDILYQMLDVKDAAVITKKTAEGGESKHPLNQILYGPPGTGKTYNSINKALEIIHDHEKFDIDWEDRAAVKSKFDELKDEGRIVFTTFHQSMSYEDFIEGIKPELVNSTESDAGDLETGFVNYEVKPGIFTALCDNARVITTKTTKRVNWSTPKFYKMSLGGKHKPEQHQWCIDNNKIALGWGGTNDLSEYVKITQWSAYRDTFAADNPELVKDSRFNTQSTYAFLHMSINDVVVVSRGNHIIDAIGIVKGPYKYSDQEEVGFYHFRDVEWIATNLNLAPDRFLRKEVSQQSIYEFNKKDIKLEAFEQLTAEDAQTSSPAPYVLIIDEINRGNVSQIFGELITLIEEDKRLGKPESLEVTLPYSKKRFGVPSNVYLIGTMNTADRSVEALDTALRRRFQFSEMMPKPELLEPSMLLQRLWLQYASLNWSDPKWINIESKFLELHDATIIDRKAYEKLENENDLQQLASKFDEVIDFNGISLSELLRTINKRIEKLLDKDHQIGHSYFMNVFRVEDLKQAFSKNIIPLLQEYFYGDYGKIGMILGEAFFENNMNENIAFKSFFDYPGDELSEKPIYCLRNLDNIENGEFMNAVKSII